MIPLVGSYRYSCSAWNHQLRLGMVRCEQSGDPSPNTTKFGKAQREIPTLALTILRNRLLPAGMRGCGWRTIVNRPKRTNGRTCYVYTAIRRRDKSQAASSRF